MKSETEKTEGSPLKTAAEELAFLRQVFRDTAVNYGTRIESQIAQVREAVLADVKNKRAAAGRIRDAREMVAVIRALELKPEKGRRRDMKKVELLLADLQRRMENW